MISALFVDRPRFAAVIAIVMTIAGLLSLLTIPVSQYPDIVPPQVSVNAIYPGASAAVVEATIAQPVEAQVVGVDKMMYMKSVSGNDGSYSLTLTFELGTDPDIDTINTNNRVQAALSKLPQEALQRGVTVEKKSAALLAMIAFTSPKGTHDSLFLSNFVTITALDAIKSTPGVGQASLFGPQDYAMRIWLQTDRLTGLGLAVSDVVAAIQAQNTQAAVGRIGARPISADQQLQLNIQTKGRLSRPEEFGAIVVRSNSDGSVLRLRDIARLELGAANLDVETHLGGAPAAAVGIYQSPGANAIKTLEAVRQTLRGLQDQMPSDLEWRVTYDATTFVTATIHEVQKTLLEAFVLVVLVVYLFLGSLRATLIPTIAVPVSLISTFIVLNAVGYSANTVSLLAMVLAIGIVVDDAIVVVENVERVIEQRPDLSVADATKLAMTEITAPVIAITMVLLSVFVPIAFIPGISGELFRQFAVTVAVSMFISAVNALSLSPALCAVLLKHHEGPRRGPIGMVMRFIDRVRDGYGAMVARLVRIALVSLPVVVVVVLGIGALGKITPTGFLPNDDQSAFFVMVQLPDGASVGRTTGFVSQVERILAADKTVQDTTSIIGYSFLDGMAQANAAFVVVTLKPFSERTGADMGVDSAIARVGMQLHQLRGGYAIPMAPPPIIGLGTGGGFSYVLEDLRGGDPSRWHRCCAGSWWRPMRTRDWTAYSARSRLPRPRCSSISIATRRRCWGCRLPRCSRRSAPTWAVPISTTSTCSAAPGRCRYRPRPPTAGTSTTSFASTSAAARA
jgi:hydrophobe/amphiphile efflux-1 (HAE1) family protein